MTLHLTPALEQELQQLAAQGHRSPDELAQEAIANFISYKKNFIAAVHEGLASAGRGEFHEHEEVMAMMDDIIANG